MNPDHWFSNLSLKTAIAVLVSVGLISAVVGYLTFSGGQSADESTVPEPVRGVACRHLHDAYNHSLAEDETALWASVQAAARSGEAALDKSGQAFGRPEEIALELEYALAQSPSQTRPRATKLLQAAKAACSTLGRWSGK